MVTRATRNDSHLYIKADLVNEFMLTWRYYDTTKLLSIKDDPFIPPSIPDASDHHDDGGTFFRGEFRETFM